MYPPVLVGRDRTAQNQKSGQQSDGGHRLERCAGPVHGPGDIGQHFSSDNDELRGISSIDLVRRSITLVTEAGYGVSNIDATVIAACHRHGQWAGMGSAYAEPEMRRYIGMGVRMVLAGGDLSLMMEAGTAMTKLVRGCV